MPSEPFGVVDLFSGTGGMSYGFHAHDSFKLLGSADAQRGKPTSASGTLGCNSSYELNIGIAPVEADLGQIDPADLRGLMGLEGASVPVMLACPPCTGFSRAQSKNHVVDDPRNSLVARVALFVREFQPKVLVMENARELVMGRFSRHLVQLTLELEDMGYQVSAETHFLSKFGLPQRRERALVVAVKRPLALLGMADLWAGVRIDEKATHVRRAIWDLNVSEPLHAGQRSAADPMHVSPSFASGRSLARIQAIPKDGGSWVDLVPESADLLNPSMLRSVAAGRLGTHPDVYGRMAWDRPAPTIKRESAHVGNGRYVHPTQDRLCTVREMAILQGFPRNFMFGGSNLANMYRHIGDAVPPLISYQLAHLVAWSLTGSRPSHDELVLHHTHLKSSDLQVAAAAS